MNNYDKFKEDDKIKSQHLSKALSVSENDIRIIDDWFATYLEKHFQAKASYDKGLAYENELKELHGLMFEWKTKIKIAEKTG